MDVDCKLAVYWIHDDHTHCDFYYSLPMTLPSNDTSTALIKTCPEDDSKFLIDHSVINPFPHNDTF